MVLLLPCALFGLFFCIVPFQYDLHSPTESCKRGKRPLKAIFSTDPTQPAEQILSDFMKRWSLEVTFEEGRAHLGIETQRQWSDRAIERSTPLLFGQALHPDGHIPVAQAAWYHKQTVTFCDVLALVGRHLWGQEAFPTSPTDPDAVLAPPLYS